MTNEAATGAPVVLVPGPVLEARVLAVLREAGADAPSAEAATRALMHASRHGVDSHGVRLAPHYARALRGGRVDGRPRLTERSTGPAGWEKAGDDDAAHRPG